jgi:hypothetical protein
MDFLERRQSAAQRRRVDPGRRVAIDAEDVLDERELVERRQGGELSGLGEDPPRAERGQDPVQAILGKGGLERDVGAAGLEDAEQPRPPPRPRAARRERADATPVGWRGR